MADKDIWRRRKEAILRFKGNFKMAAITALGLLLLATVAGLAISALTTVRDATEDTPAEFVGVSAEAAVGPVTAVVSVAPTSPIEPGEAAANETPQAPDRVSNIKFDRSANGAEIKVRWDKVDDATHYHLNYTDDDGTSWHRYVSDIPAKKVPISIVSHPECNSNIAVEAVNEFAGEWTTTTR